ncbi:MAG: integrin alpha, partial [Pseudomonadota bacterium]
ASYVVFGSSDGFGPSLELASLDGANGFRLDGVDAFDGSGNPVSGAGDVNGDGIDDLIVGARGGDPPGRFDAGESYVVFGRRSGEPALTLVVNPDSVAEDGAPATATLTRNTDIGTALTVALASSDVGEATVPRAVEIPIGQRSVTFDVTPRTDGLVDGDQTATIAASATGFSEVSADVEVTDVDG